MRTYPLLAIPAPSLCTLRRTPAVSLPPADPITPTVMHGKRPPGPHMICVVSSAVRRSRFILVGHFATPPPGCQRAQGLVANLTTSIDECELKTVNCRLDMET